MELYEIQKECFDEAKMLMTETPIAIAGLTESMKRAVESALFTSLEKMASSALGRQLEIVGSELEQCGRDMAVNFIESPRHSEEVVPGLFYVTKETLDNARKCKVYAI